VGVIELSQAKKPPVSLKLGPGPNLRKIVLTPNKLDSFLKVV